MPVSQWTSRTIIGNNKPLLSVAASASSNSKNWKIKLSKTIRGPAGDRRLGLATKRLVELDAIVAERLRKGQIVNVNGTFSPVQIDGPHTAAEQVAPLLLPSEIESCLYPYQNEGVAWLLQNQRALLGDDMGLGKTAQALLATRQLIRNGEVSWALVIAPRTLVTNWVSEIKRWAPELTVASAHPTANQKEACWRKLVRRAHFLVTNYEQIREPSKSLYQYPPDLIIADEAHRIRKSDSQATKGVRSLNSKRFWALTGTPIERDSEDLTVLMSILDPHRFAPDDKSMHCASLRARVKPYILRRHKKDVLNDLPSVIEDNEILELTSSQREIYQNSITLHNGALDKNNFLLLFNRLRSICDVDQRNGSSSKLDRIIQLIPDIVNLKEKVIVFSYMLEPIRWLEKRLQKDLPNIGYALMTGKNTADERTKLLQEFKNSKKCNVLIASTRIASEGLTLTEANHVFFINRWWNPSSNNQARDRVVRIGQSRAVHIKSFTCQGTVEERLDKLLDNKKMTFEELINALKQSPLDISDKISAGIEK